MRREIGAGPARPGSLSLAPVCRECDHGCVGATPREERLYRCARNAARSPISAAFSCGQARFCLRVSMSMRKAWFQMVETVIQGESKPVHRSKLPRPCP